MLEMINGKKTYIIIILSGIFGLLGSGETPIWVVPEWVWTMDAMLFAGAIRSAMSKMEK